MNTATQNGHRPGVLGDNIPAPAPSVFAPMVQGVMVPASWFIAGVIFTKIFWPTRKGA